MTREEKKLPDWLDEAAVEYENEHTYQRYDGGGLTPEYDATLAEAFIDGAELMKAKMMEKAVDGYVTLTLTGALTAAATIREGGNIGIGDKVRVIVIKEGK